MAARRPAVLLALALTLVGVVAACGGGDDAAGDTDTGIIGLPAETVGEAPTSEAPPPAPPSPAALVVVKLPKGEPLRQGDSGPQVTNLQKALKMLGYKVGTVDGEYGPKLAAAVAAFQAKNKLANDGVAGKKTVRKINQAVKKRTEG
jgi:peptidoglycan hydrolase-like protein with peptidoglycan-binding domain